MSLVPLEGQTYRYTGDLRSHRGLYGVASNIYPVGRLYRLTLSNHADWARCGLAPSLECFSNEISPAEPAEPLHPPQISVDGPRLYPKTDELTLYPAPAGVPKPTLGQWYRVKDKTPGLRMKKGLLSEMHKRGEDWLCMIVNGGWVGWYLASTLEPMDDPTFDAFTGPEKDLVKEACDWLKENGFEWGVVGQLKAKGSGTTEGFPDLWVRHPAWPRGLWVAIELKTATGTLSDEQERLHKAGGSYVARSVTDVADILAPLHEAMRGWRALATVILKGLSPMLPPV